MLLNREAGEAEARLLVSGLMLAEPEAAGERRESMSFARRALVSLAAGTMTAAFVPNDVSLASSCDIFSLSSVSTATLSVCCRDKEKDDRALR